MLKKQQHIHFVGIGGIGMSGLAHIVRQQGFIVSGCDVNIQSSICKDLAAQGCILFEGHDAAHLDAVDVVVYSTIIKQHHPEMVTARKMVPSVISRAHMLAQLMSEKTSIAVTGMHGKTTTTSMVAHVLFESGRDPSIAIGGIMQNMGTNARKGDGDFFVAEADESDRSMVLLNPTMAIITNIDLEHLETYKNLDDIKATFVQFMEKIPCHGALFVSADCPNTQAVFRDIDPSIHFVSQNTQGVVISKTISFGLSDSAHVRAINIQNLTRECSFEVVIDGVVLGRIIMNVTGEHNIRNALAAIALALHVGIPFDEIAVALATFAGVVRRFEFRGTFKGIEIFDDYAHHPVEIVCALNLASERAEGRLVVAFQPHKYSRVHGLWHDFIQVLSDPRVDVLIMAEIYPAFETPIDGVTSKALIEHIQKKNPHLKIIYCFNIDEVESEARQLLESGDFLLTMGAGRLDVVAGRLVDSVS